MPGLLRLAKAKSHDIYCDAELNTGHVVHLNIYQNLVLSAMKMHSYIRTWGIDVAKNWKFIHSERNTLVIYGTKG